MKYGPCQLVLSEEYGSGMQIIPEQRGLGCSLLAPTLQSQVINNWAKGGRQGKAISLPRLTVAHCSLASRSLCPFFSVVSTFCHSFSPKLRARVLFFFFFFFFYLLSSNETLPFRLSLHQPKLSQGVWEGGV